MTNLFDEDWKAQRPEDQDSFSITADININKTDRLPGTARSLLGKQIENDRLKREQQNAFFGISPDQGKTSDASGLPGLNESKPADNAKLKWNWSGLQDETFKPRQDEPAHNAALIGLESIGQGERHQNPLERREQTWGRQFTGSSFRAVPEHVPGAAPSEAERLERIRNLPDFYETAIERARSDEKNAEGFSAYQQHYQTVGNAGTKASGQLANSREWSGHPVGKVYNQAALSGVMETLDSTPGKVLGTVGEVINKSAQENGGEKLIPTTGDMYRNVKQVRDDSLFADNLFADSNGQLTKTGATTQILNNVVAVMPEAAFLVNAVHQWGAKLVSSLAIPLDISHSYYRKFEDALTHYQTLSPESLYHDQELMAQKKVNEEVFAMNEPQAFKKAMSDIAERRAKEQISGSVIKNLMAESLSKLAPEEQQSFVVDLVKTGSLLKLTDWVGSCLDGIFSRGEALHQGDTGVTTPY